MAGVLVLALLGVGIGVWFAREARWQGALYCIERPGMLWKDVAAVPDIAQPECPSSRSYRQEVRAGESRVEQYRLPGWQPRALVPLLGQGGYRQITDEDIGPGNYAAFLGRAGVPELQYLAAQEGDTTLITLSGRP
ncbi:hypothetical protein GCM10010841_05010 [Deinococcus aerophilus]|uniref:Uncharacterized protein n=2 Tax=Deinococcus aerophilus TaxID=522488 RepID=A0ABQ2GJH1_9DEIO|nr:hypothetical protein GCM10010841_05010 [Deinococcus aerophilus]